MLLRVRNEPARMTWKLRKSTFTVLLTAVLGYSKSEKIVHDVINIHH